MSETAFPLSSIDFGLLQSAITLLIGLLIFFTVRHFQLSEHRTIPGKPESETNEFRIRQGWIYLITLIFSVAAVIFALLENGTGSRPSQDIDYLLISFSNHTCG